MKNFCILTLLAIAGCASNNTSESPQTHLSEGVQIIDHTGGKVRLTSGESRKLGHFIPPKYPPHLRESGVTGEVKIQFTVLPDGSLTNLTVVKSAHPQLDEQALAAVASWKFAPDDSRRRENLRLEVPIKFEITNKSMLP